MAAAQQGEGTLREPSATAETVSAKPVRCSSAIVWLSCECVRLLKMTCKPHTSAACSRKRTAILTATPCLRVRGLWLQLRGLHLRRHALPGRPTDVR